MLNKIADFFHKITLRMEYRALKKELDDILEKAVKLKPRKCYIYLNNDTGMLSNGLYLIKKAKLLRNL